MTSLDARPRNDTASDTTEPLSGRIRRGAPLIVGAVVILLLLQPIGSLPLKGWVPILTGLTFVAAGLIGGRRGLLVGPGIVLASWGVAPLSTNYDTDFPGMFYLCLGTGLLIAAFLAERGWRGITPMSLAIPVLFIGGVMFIAPRVDPYLTTVLAVIIVAYAVWEMRPQRADDKALADSRA
jgi:hypothetical protein